MYDYGTFLYESHICSKYEAMILNWFHNRAEYFVQIMCKFQKVSCHRNETARSNILPTVNKCFNCIICTCKGVVLVPSVLVCLWCCSWIINIKTVATYKGVALVPSVSVCLCWCIWITNTKLVATDVQCLGLCRWLHLIFFFFLFLLYVQPFICSSVRTSRRHFWYSGFELKHWNWGSWIKFLELVWVMLNWKFL